MDKIQITDEEALQKFLLDIQCLDELVPWTGKFNIFDVLKASRNEIRHSNMLAWLLDPNENHGLGDAFLKCVFQRLIEKDDIGRYDIFNILLCDMDSFSVYREWKNIDILLISQEEKIVFAIENKVGSHEHSNQLNRYRKILESEYSDYNKIYVFLTPDGESPSDVENWDVLTYMDIVEILENLKKRVKFQSDVSVMIDNYIEIIRRDIVEDQQLIEICNRIYNKHRKALDLIYANRTDSKNQLSNLITEALNKLEEEGLIIYSGNWGNMAFRTEKMDKLLPLLKNGVSSWKNEQIYAYWLNFDGNRFYGVLELAGQNVPDNEIKVMQKIIDILKPNDTRRENFTYKRIYRTGWHDLEGVMDSKEDIENEVRCVINELLDMESNLINKINI